MARRYCRSLGNLEEVDFLFSAIYNRGFEEFLENHMRSTYEFSPYSMERFTNLEFIDTLPTTICRNHREFENQHFTYNFLPLEMLMQDDELVKIKTTKDIAEKLGTPELVKIVGEEAYEKYMKSGNYSKAKEIAEIAELGEEKINLAEVLEEGSGEYLGEIELPNGTKIPLILYIE